MTGKPKSHWWVLIILALAQFMVVLDASIVNVALPAISTALHIGQSSLQWIVTAYTLAFGGFLLLGGRAADLYGRKKLFLIGVAVFGVASLIDGLAPNGGVLIGLRAAQGLAAAFMSPAALSIVLVTYREGHARNTALSVWGAVAAGGAAAGVLLGGLITEYLGWRWNFLVNVPVSIAVLIAAARMLPTHESEETHNDLDLAGAVSITGGLMLLVYAITQAPKNGWLVGSTLSYLFGAILLIAFFVWNENRVKHPLVPFAIFKIRNVWAANFVQLFVVGGMFSVFFFTSLYLQLVLHYSPVKTGLSFLTIPMIIGISATQTPRLIQRIGFKPILAVSPLIVAVGLFLLGHVPVHGSYVRDILPGFLLLGLGMGATFVSITIAATAGVTGRESGLASGLLNTTQQIGGALGLAILTGISSSRAASYLKHVTFPNPTAAVVAQVQGYHAAYYAAASFMILAVVTGILSLKEQRLTAEQIAAASGAPAA
jgi:EmrB/QacA subfamily drug resistance transporter